MLSSPEWQGRLRDAECASSVPTCLLCGLPAKTTVCDYCTLRFKSPGVPETPSWPPTKNTLAQLYVASEMSVHRIAKLYGKSYSTVMYWMARHGIYARDRESAARMSTRRYPVRSFSSGLEDKAYLLGLAVGDLNVSRDHKSISIYTSTSVVPMVELVADAFMRYARPAIRPMRYHLKHRTIGGWRIRFLLDQSFEFLLDKYRGYLPSWISDSDQLVYAFLGGLFDAEGHVGIYGRERGSGGPVAQLTFTNTDPRLVNWVYNALTLRGFPVRVAVQGTPQTFWYRVTLQQLEYIQKLLRLMPFRHPKKKAVARLLLSIPNGADKGLKLRVVRRFKELGRLMKDDARFASEVSLALAAGFP